MAVNWSNPWGLGLIFATVLVMAFSSQSLPVAKIQLLAVSGDKAPPSVTQTHCTFPFLSLRVMVDQRSNNNLMSVFLLTVFKISVFQRSPGKRGTKAAELLSGLQTATA